LERPATKDPLQCESRRAVKSAEPQSSHARKYQRSNGVVLERDHQTPAQTLQSTKPICIHFLAIDIQWNDSKSEHEQSFLINKFHQLKEMKKLDFSSGRIQFLVGREINYSTQRTTVVSQ
jgi:hypothetical protein